MLQIVVLEKTLESPSDNKIKPANPKENQRWIFIHWKDCCCSSSSNTLATWCKQQTHWQRPWCWERLKAKGEGVAEDEMVRWHYQFNGHELEQTPGESGGQRSVVCYSLWDHRVRHNLETEKQNLQRSYTVLFTTVSQPNHLTIATLLCRSSQTHPTPISTLPFVDLQVFTFLALTGNLHQ